MPREITPQRLERIRQVLRRRQKSLTLVMDNIWDPHNVSAVLRSCDAFGVFGVHLYYTTSEWPDLGKKSSGSAVKWVNRTRHDDAREMIAGLRSQGYQILRTGFSASARELGECDLARPTAVILSNEHRGTSPELAELVSDEVYIPMQGMIQSFNVSVAAALILYEAFTQRDARGMYNTASLSDEELLEVEALWSQR